MSFEIPTTRGSYVVEFLEGALRKAASIAPPPYGAEKVLLVADATTAALYGEQVARSYQEHAQVVTFTLPSGESSKSAATLEALWRFAASENMHRKDVIVALGGGVVGDVAGFAAATFARGIPWIALPTTLLAMVDASIGGKTAIDLPEGKNLAGSFHPPIHVLADPETLQTLPEREFRTGLAEVVKHALISPGPLRANLLDQQAAINAREPFTLAALLPEAASVKVEIVRVDETEQGERAYLNYGHTLAHAIETCQGYQGLSHGEAVAVGLRCAALIARKIGLPDLVDEHDALLTAFKLRQPVELPASDDLVTAMRRDKKYDQGLVWILLEELGRPTTARVPDNVVLEVLGELGAE
jgi:3-dehydroquinate synthase